MIASIWAPNGFSPESIPFAFFEGIASTGQTVISISPYTALLDSQLQVFVAGQLQNTAAWSISGTQVILSVPMTLGQSYRVDIYAASPVIDEELPSQGGNAGKFLTTDGTNPAWADVPEELPDQTGNAGKILSTTGTVPVWTDVPTELPSQTGNAGKILSTNGVVPSWVTQSTGIGMDVLASYIPAAMWETLKDGTSTDDHTVYMQAAINAASNSTTRKLFFCAGKWNFTVLRTYYDAILNPGYNVKRNAELEFIGEGMTNENEALTDSPCGTIFNHTSLTGNGLIISSTAQDISPWIGRDFIARDMSIVSGTSGYAFESKGVPQLCLYNFEVIQTNASGSYMDISTAYLAEIARIRTRKSVYASSPAQKGIRFNNTAPGAGLFTLRDSIIGDCVNAFEVVGGNWTSMSFYNSELKADVGGHGFIVRSGANVDQVNFYGPYFENNAVSWIKDETAGGIKNLYISGIWGLDAAWLSGPAIDLQAPDSVHIAGGFLRELRKPFLNIAAVSDPNASGNFCVSNLTFKYYSSPGANVTLFTGIIPELHGMDINGGSQGSFVSLYANTKFPIRIKPYFGADSSDIFAGHIREIHQNLISPGGAGGTVYTHAGQGYPAVQYISTTANNFYDLDLGTTANLGDLFNLWIYNAGTGVLTVRNRVAGTTITTIAGGTGKTFKWSTTYGAWHIVD